MKSKKKKPWLAWLLAIGVCTMVPCAIIGKSIWGEFRSKVGSNKTFILTSLKDHFDGKNIDDQVMETDRTQVNTVFSEVENQMGKFESFGDPDTIPSVNDAISKGWELSYNVPTKFEKGYKTLTVRVRNEGFNQKIVSLLAYDGILPKDNVRTRIQKHL